MSHYRCAICNSVSARDIETDIGDFSDKAFLPDPSSDKHQICLECAEVIEEQRHYWQVKDNWWGEEDFEWLDEDHSEDLIVVDLAEKEPEEELDD